MSMFAMFGSAIGVVASGHETTRPQPRTYTCDSVLDDVCVIPCTPIHGASYLGQHAAGRRGCTGTGCVALQCELKQYDTTDCTGYYFTLQSNVVNGCP